MQLFVSFHITSNFVDIKATIAFKVKISTVFFIILLGHNLGLLYKMGRNLGHF
ncbi:gp25 [Brochothrix phage NF5]|uniref:gp25 n=1 Tax=Brochothrix phage NF5 TaxID=764561 RepID=UPI0001D9ACA4|nr:gp25 [Brochothrix phage NF5]ADH03047.1 gp25 [Brochothrix phage NF5]